MYRQTSQKIDWKKYIKILKVANIDGMFFNFVLAHLYSF